MSKAATAGKAGVAGGLILCSAFLLAHLTQWESGGTRVLTVYADRLANGLPTVCNGVTRHVTDVPIIVGEVWTDEKCEAVERPAIVKIQHTLLGRCFRVPPPQSVLDMATSHAWNFGVEKTCASRAMQAWRMGDWQLGCRRIQFHDDGRPAWSYAGGKLIPGLQNRRADERLKCEGQPTG